VVLVDYVPLRDGFVQRVEFFARERGHATAAGDAFLVG
jgi:hypothetical protein